MSSRESSQTGAPGDEIDAELLEPEAEPRAPDAIVPAPAEGRIVPSRDDRDVGPVDALTRYTAELAKYPPISREEEHELAVRWREEGDLEAGRRLVLANLRLVVKIAMEYRRAWNNVLDLIQEGNVGLMQALHRFDPYQGVKLSSYGAYWIRAYILKYVIDNIRMVRLGKTRAQRKLFFRLNKEKRELERQGFKPEPKLLAARLEVSEADIVDMEQRLSESDLSLDAPIQREGSRAEFGDFIAAPTEDAESVVGDSQLRETFMEKVQEFAATIDDREQKILQERVLADDPKTLQDLGKEFGVSRERVRQLEARLMERLQEYLRENLVDYDFYTTSRD